MKKASSVLVISFVFILILQSEGAGLLEPCSNTGECNATNPNAYCENNTCIECGAMRLCKDAGYYCKDGVCRNDFVFFVCETVLYVILTIGFVAFLMIIFNGYRWLTSGDDPPAREDAKTSIIHAILGLMIIGFSMTIIKIFYGGVTPCF